MPTLQEALNDTSQRYIVLPPQAIVEPLKVTTLFGCLKIVRDILNEDVDHDKIHAAAFGFTYDRRGIGYFDIIRVEVEADPLAHEADYPQADSLFVHSQQIMVQTHAEDISDSKSHDVRSFYIALVNQNSEPVYSLTKVRFIFDDVMETPQCAFIQAHHRLYTYDEAIETIKAGSSMGILSTTPLENGDIAVDLDFGFRYILTLIKEIE